MADGRLLTAIDKDFWKPPVSASIHRGRSPRRGSPVPMGAGFFGHRSPLACFQTSAHAGGGGGGCMGGGLPPDQQAATLDQVRSCDRSLGGWL